MKRITGDLAAAGRSPEGELRRRLDRLLEERNWLVHRSLQQQVEEATPRAAGQFTARLQKLAAEASAMTEYLRQLILARFVRAGMTQIEFERKAKDVIQRWLAA